MSSLRPLNAKHDVLAATCNPSIHDKAFSKSSLIPSLTKATGWQPHSVRGFFAGVVRKKLGLTLLSEKPGEERVYRIVAKNVVPKRKFSRAHKAA